MSFKVRVGVIGTSGWADFMYLSSLHSHPQAELAAICGRNQGQAGELAAKYGIPQVYSEYQAMIGQAGLDALIVGAPDDLHHAMTMRALGAGLHVLCDKPLASTAQQAQEMYNAAEGAGVRHMVLFTFRWMPFYRYVRDLIDQGYVGRLYHAEFRFLMGHARKPEYQWRLDRQRANGALGDLGVHMIDMARFLIGDMTRLSAQLGVYVERPGADGGRIDPANDAAIILAEFANGAQGVIQASLVAHLGDRFMQQQVRLCGEAGTLELDVQYQGAQAGVRLYAARDQEEQMRRLEVPASYYGGAGRDEPFAVFTQQPLGPRGFIDAILENRPATPSFYDGYKAQQVIDAALQAHQSGSRVAVQDPADV